MGNLRNRLFVALILLLTAGTTPPALAADACPPLKGTWLDLTPTANGYLVPVTIAGTPRMLLLDLGQKYSELNEKIVAEMKLPTTNSKETFESIGGKWMGTPTAVVPAVQIGEFTRSDAAFLARPYITFQGPKSDGVLARNFLDGYDFELDFAHNRLGLFLPDHCSFVPYWKHDVVGNAPYRVAPLGAFSVPMVLDDKQIYGLLYMTAETTSMPLMSAQILFKIDEDDPVLVPVSKDAFGNKVYRYPFKELTMDNLTIKNPEIRLTGTIAESCRDSFSNCRCWTRCEVFLGLDVLRQLRLFFDSKEQTVYFTLAEPQSSP